MEVLSEPQASILLGAISLPVLLFLHSPDDGVVYWTDVRQALRNPAAVQGFIVIPKHSRLQYASASDLFATTGASSQPYLPIDDVLLTLASRTAPAGTFTLSYLELFALGLTNGGRAIYYGMDLVMQIAEVLRDHDELTLRAQEHEYLFGFVLFLVEQRLADVDISDCLTDWYDRLMQPRFLAPLTSRGRALVHLMRQREDEMIVTGLLERTARDSRSAGSRNARSPRESGSGTHLPSRGVPPSVDPVVSVKSLPVTRKLDAAADFRISPHPAPETPMHPNAALIHRFYDSFAALDAAGMQACSIRTWCSATRRSASCAGRRRGPCGPCSAPAPRTCR